MPRAGSGWYYNLVHDLVVASGGQNARSIREQFRLQRFLTEVNCNISTLKPYRLMPVLFPALLGNKYVIKTHAGPTSFTRWMLRKQMIKTIYIYRDPKRTEQGARLGRRFGRASAAPTRRWADAGILPGTAQVWAGA